MKNVQKAICWSIGFAIAMAGQAASAQQPVKRLVEEETASVSACLVPLQPGDKDFGSFGGFRNNCDYIVEYSFCVQNPADGSWASSAPCQTGRETGTLDRVGPRGISGAHLYGGTRAHWFACRQAHSSGEGPAGIWGQVVFDGSVVRGKCQYNRYVTVSPAAKPTGPNTPGTGPATAGSPVSAQVTATARLGAEAWQRGDHTAAIKHWRIAADAGDPSSAYNLGVAYRVGKGVPVDQAQSDLWFNKAAQQGHKQAIYQSALSLIRSRRYAEARAMLEKAVAGGDPNSQYLLGILLVNGNGGPVDRVRGRKLIAQAAAQGLQAAKDQLARMDGTAPPQRGQVTPKVTPAAVRTSGGTDPIWAACEGPIMTYLGSFNPPATSPAEVQRTREALSFPKMNEIWSQTPDSELQSHIYRWEHDFADAPGVRVQICQMNAYISARRARK